MSFIPKADEDDGKVQAVTDGSSTAEEAQKSVRGLEDSAIHTKYIELVWTAYTSYFSSFLRFLLLSLLNSSGKRETTRRRNRNLLKTRIRVCCSSFR